MVRTIRHIFTIKNENSQCFNIDYLKMAFLTLNSSLFKEVNLVSTILI